MHGRSLWTHLAVGVGATTALGLVGVAWGVAFVIGAFLTCGLLMVVVGRVATPPPVEGGAAHDPGTRRSSAEGPADGSRRKGHRS